MTGSHEVRGSIPLSSTAHKSFLAAQVVWAAVLILGCGCSKDRWLLGDWLLVTESGKPSVCHRFLDSKQLVVSQTSSCLGDPDPVLSGRWQLRDEKTLAILRGSAPLASPALIVTRDERHVVLRGALAGSLYRLSDPDPTALLAELRQRGDIRLLALPPAWGCRLFNTRLADIEALPPETQPRMLRSKDVHARHYRLQETESPAFAKAVFSVALDRVEWLALHLSAQAYRPPGPAGNLEALLGPPVRRTAFKGPDTVQEVFMWRAYCTELRGAFHKDIDLTLFSHPQEQQGVLYLSEGVISDLWDDLVTAAAEAS